MLWLLVHSCSPKVDDSKLFSSMPSSLTGITFKNLLGETEEFNVLEYGYLYNGGGVAAGDLNNDGLIDLYFTGNMVGSHLYINQGDLVFKEIAKDAGVFAEGLWNTGVTMADVNADGFLDIYVCRSAAPAESQRRNLLFINNGDLTFSEKAEEYGIADSGYSTQGSFFDYDRDGDLDLYVLNHSTQEYAGFGQITASLKNRNNKAYSDKLYRNDNGKFTDVSDEAGLISNVLGFGLGIAVSDVTNDGWLDIYISNDYNEQDYLYINNRDGTFSERLEQFIGHTSLFSMGSDVADINNDGYMDIMTLDMLPEGNFRQKMVSGPDNYEKHALLEKSGFYNQNMRNMLQLNQQGQHFSEIGQFSGISNTDWSWGPLIADFDSDGFKDIFITNGYKRDYTNMDFMNYAVQEKLNEDKTGTKTSILSLLDEIPATIIENYMYRNNGDLSFTKVNTEWGFHQKSLSNGAVYADLDNDGDLDIVVNNIDEEAFVYRNNANVKLPNKALRIKLKGSSKNPNGIGTKVIITTGNTKQTQEFIPVRGYQSAMLGPLTFGLGAVDTVDSLKVIWPDGLTETLTNIVGNGQLRLDYSNAKVEYKKPKVVETMFASISHDSLITYVHNENTYNDFRRERLLPHMLSTQGPRMAKADVNNDGLEDVFIPGAKNSASVLFLQQKNGKFKNSNTTLFEKTAIAEDVKGLFFDADGDLDQDLYVVSGGNEVAADDPLLQDRLYLNDGNGNFSLASNALPNMITSGLAITSADMDGDGDLDLFVGGRLVPGQYPLAPNSYILENDGKGNFTNSTKKLAPAIHQLGMVTDAVFQDLNGDNRPDLIIVGEWMPITIIMNTEKGLVPLIDNKGIANSEGWWNRIKATDIDNDGDIDFVLGNHGLNSQLQASTKEPVSLYYKDFDGNGSIDPILTSYIQGAEYPVFSKDDMTEQLAGLKSKYINYSEYADQQLNEIFTTEQRMGMDTLRARTFAHSILENKGSMQFAITPLPSSTQWAPIFAIADGDLNVDGKTDLVLAGNFFGSRVKFGRYDANNGVALMGTDAGWLKTVSNEKSGLNIKGEVRDVISLKNTKGQTVYFFSQNNGPLQLYSLQEKQQNP